MLVLSSSGCGLLSRRVVVLRGEDEVYFVREGDPAPITGYLLSPARLSKLYEQVRGNVTEDTTR